MNFETLKQRMSELENNHENHEQSDQIENELEPQTVYGRPKRLYFILGLIYLIGLILLLVSYFC